MAGVWFCKLAGVTTGPLKSSELLALAQAGKLGPEDLVRHGPEGRWVPARNVRGLFTSRGQVGSSASSISVSTPVSSQGESLREEVSLGESTPSTNQGVGPGPPVPKARPLPEPPPPPERPFSKTEGLVEETPGEIGIPDFTKSAAPSFHSPAQHSAVPPGLHRRRSKNHWAMILGLAGLAVVLLVAVILVFTGVFPVGGSGFGQKEAAVPIASQKSEVLAPGDSAGQAASEVVWADASKKAIRREGTGVRILSVRLAPAPASLVETGGDYLLVEVQVDNRSEDKILLFKPWSDGVEDGTVLKLTDNQGNIYRQVLHSGVLGAKDAANFQKLLPSQSAQDTLVFEPPKDLEQIEYLRMELPGNAFPKERFESFRFQISRKMIRTGAESSAESPTKAEELFGPSRPSTPSAKSPSSKPSEESAIPKQKRDSGQEELDQLLKQLEKEKGSEMPPSGGDPSKTDSSQPKTEKSESPDESEPSESQESKPRRPSLPGREIFDQLDTPVPSKSSQEGKE